MQDDYYQNTLYPLQDRVLKIVSQLPVDFYLTGGTALGRVYLHHRYSDDLDFFVNNARDFKQQVNTVVNALKISGLSLETATADETYARLFIYEKDCILKLDFVNDVPFRNGTPINTELFFRIDTTLNILSNKISALSRYSPKDVVDIIFLAQITQFDWENIFNDASEKDLWANPINAAEVLEGFPLEKLKEIAWIGESPSNDWILSQITRIITDILDGGYNSLFAQK